MFSLAGVTVAQQAQKDGRKFHKASVQLSGRRPVQCAQPVVPAQERITDHGYYQIAATLFAVGANVCELDMPLPTVVICANSEWLPAACAAIWLTKESYKKPHLTSIHGKCGAATLVMWIILQVFGGLLWCDPGLHTAFAGTMTAA